MELEATGGKQARATRAILAVDRLSALPDCLIHHIMSFMKARQVVQTCVLSTRWTHLWRSVPCLDIDLEEFKTTSTNNNCSKEDWMKFEDFTDHLLIPNKISIALLDTFRLNVRDTNLYCKQQTTRWIRHGIKYSSQQPSIQRDLLGSCSWRLKRLHLSHIYLEDCFAQHVSSGCPYLEDLVLQGCRCELQEITSHSLKSLVLENCNCWRLSAITSPTLKSLVINGGNNSRDLLVITAHAVAYLLLDVTVYRFPGGISLNKMPSLAKASIQLQTNDMEDKLRVDKFKFLDGVSNASSFVMSGLQTMILCEGFPTFPHFNNLKTLLLDECDLSDNFQILGHFLRNSPNLEKLTLCRCMAPIKLTTKLKECLNLVGVQCKNLKLTEIIYEDEDDHDDVHTLVQVFQSISGNLPNNNIKTRQS
ncbi:hypothetical protein ACP70R_011651 [Stipagrostis hirtigluma subsp. patula]